MDEITFVKSFSKFVGPIFLRCKKRKSQYKSLGTTGITELYDTLKTLIWFKSTLFMMLQLRTLQIHWYQKSYNSHNQENVFTLSTFPQVWLMWTKENNDFFVLTQNKIFGYFCMCMPYDNFYTYPPPKKSNHQMIFCNFKSLLNIFVAFFMQLY